MVGPTSTVTLVVCIASWIGHQEKGHLLTSVNDVSDVDNLAQFGMSISNYPSLALVTLELVSK